MDKKLDDNRELSRARVVELRAGRKIDDIPLHDEYWVAVLHYRKAHETTKN